MTLFLLMLPVYLLGNFHCIGMCGPLVAMLGKHRYRAYYFLGRTLSFSLAGWIAGSFGAVITAFFGYYHLSAATSFLFGGIILIVALCSLGVFAYPRISLLAKPLEAIGNSFSLLLLRDQPWTTFLFGLLTIALPCGQTVIVYSACALYGDATVGLCNGMAFALLTSPSLLLAMHIHRTMPLLKRYHNSLIGAAGLVVAILTLCRGLAEIEAIPHWVVYTSSDAAFHMAIF